jgi:uncharacterized protein (UPF0261 family)
LGAIIAHKVNGYVAPAAIMIPTKAISVISAPGKPFHDSAADEALFSSLRRHSKVPVHSFDVEINDPAFAHACARQLIEFMQAKK